MSYSVPIIIEEYAGIDRTNEPVTMGIPFPRGSLTNISELRLLDSQDGYLPLQTQPLSKWPDGSLKWVLFDFQVSVKANTIKEFELTWDKLEKTSDSQYYISGKEHQNYIYIDTKAASFFVNTMVFKPFERVVIDESDILEGTKSRTLLTDETGTEYEPLINRIFFETKGILRTTLKFEGEFKSSNKLAFASFFSRVTFYANSSMVKIDFTILNPKAAKHPGGLWDLGGKGSIYFDDLSINVSLKSTSKTDIMWKTQLNNPINSTNSNNLIIYQDSSGGKNWKSLNHVNRNGEVKNTFRGYRVYLNGNLIEEGLRANPIISIKDRDKQISGAVQYFWQNFPRALESKDNTLIIRLFPHQYNDVFELQGGEQKTHTIFLNFTKGFISKSSSLSFPLVGNPSSKKDYGPIPDRAGARTAMTEIETKCGLTHDSISNSTIKERNGLEWLQTPLIPRTTPEWYSLSKALNYLIPEKEDPNREYINLINVTIEGENSFFKRREIIDEYGWRNFGELYADHETVGHKGTEPLISHYNNQYDVIYGALVQYIRSGDLRWFILADQLCSHVKDIDIYHTDNDRPEYNRGLFWHTEHYIDARTATHRCFSARHAEYRNMASYGGGPALSHNYSTGFLFHYYLTGSYSSLEAVKELASFVENNIYSENTLSNHILKGFKKIKFFLNNVTGKQSLVQITKVYGLDGPGRASGNALNTLLDAYILTNNERYMEEAGDLIRNCIHPDDDIDKRDLLDIENRWMYTVFLQSLGKYLDVKTEQEQFDYMWKYARESLINYAKWMMKNEYLFLSKPDKLEFPNETWAIQDIRKCNVLLYAAKYSDSPLKDLFLQKAGYFYNEGLKYLLKFETKTLTRPIALLMLNGMMYSYFKSHKMDDIKFPEHSYDFEKVIHNKSLWRSVIAIPVSIAKTLMNFSLKKEIQFLKWRLISK